MSILAAATNSGESDLGNAISAIVFFVVVLVLAGIAVLAYAAWARTRSTDVHVNADVRVSGTVRHEVAGTVHHAVEHSGTVQHVHQLDPTDRQRLDRLADPLLLPPGPPPAVLRREEQTPAVYRYAPQPVEAARPPQVLERRPSWPEIEQ